MFQKREHREPLPLIRWESKSGVVHTYLKNVNRDVNDS